MENDVLNSIVWARAVYQAASMGVQHAQMLRRPMTARQLWAVVGKNLGVALTGCNAHPNYLRNVYGGAYNGVKLSQEAINRRAEQRAAEKAQQSV